MIFAARRDLDSAVPEILLRGCSPKRRRKSLEVLSVAILRPSSMQRNWDLCHAL